MPDRRLAPLALAALTALAAACSEPTTVVGGPVGTVAAGAVLDSLGRAVRGAEILVGVSAPPPAGAGGDPCVAGGMGLLSLARAVSDADGRYRVAVPAADGAVVPPRCVLVVARVRDTTARAGEPLLAGASVVQPLPAAAEVGGTLRLRTSIREAWGPDDEWALVARTSVPGFAGLIFDGCTLVALVTDPATQEAAARRFAAAVALRNGACPAGPPPIAVRRVAHDFAQLRRWFDRVQPLTWLDGFAGGIDIDESRNRLVLGYDSPAARRRAERALAQLDVPAGAVLFESP